MTESIEQIESRIDVEMAVSRLVGKQRSWARLVLEDGLSPSAASRKLHCPDISNQVRWRLDAILGLGKR